MRQCQSNNQIQSMPSSSSCAKSATVRAAIKTSTTATKASISTSDIRIRLRGGSPHSPSSRSSYSSSSRAKDLFISTCSWRLLLSDASLLSCHTHIATASRTSSHPQAEEGGHPCIFFFIPLLKDIHNRTVIRVPDGSHSSQKGYRVSYTL